MNQLLFEINEIPLIIEPKIIRQNKIASITGFYKENQSNKEYKYVFQEFDSLGFCINFEKYNAQGKLICKRNFDEKGRLLNEMHFKGDEELEYQYIVDYEIDKAIKTMKDPQGNVLGKTIISINSDEKHYRVSNYNKTSEIISEFEYFYKDESGFPDITSKTRGDYSFKEENNTISLTENVPSAPKNNPDIIFYRDIKSMQIIKVEKKNSYTIHYKTHTY